MYHALAKGLVVPLSSPLGNLVSRAIDLPPNNGLLVCVTAIGATLTAPTPLFVVGISTSNDLQNWETDVVNFLSITGVGYFEKKFTELGSRYVRLVYATNSLASGIVAAGIDVADL